MAHLKVVLASLVLRSTCAGKAPLPDLDTVLTKATSKAHDFAEQAAAMQQRLLDQQEESRAALVVQKREFEQRLDHMQQQNENISVENSELLVDNTAAEHDTSVLFAELKEIQVNNTQMRAALQSLADKTSTAQLFVVDSLKVTDDSQAQELMFLTPTTPKPTLDIFLDVATGRKVSLLAIDAKLRHYPSELVSGLSNSLSEIKAAEDEGAADLKAHFMTNMAETQERLAQLNATHAKLLQRKAQLQVYRGKLHGAKAHLRATSEQLQDRLSRMRMFAERVDSTVASTLAASNASQTSPVSLNATQTANASLSAAQKTGAVVNQTKPVSSTVAAVGAVVNQTNPASSTVAAVGNAVAAFMRAVSKQPALAQPALRKTEQAGLKQGASVQASKGDAWTSWFAKLR